MSCLGWGESMRLTRAGEYAIRCISYLSKKDGDAWVPKLEIVENVEVPASFLAKIVQDLSKSGLIEIKQGAKGGYRLLKSPEDITLLEVVEIMIGRIYLNDCLGNPSSCQLNDTCKVHNVWESATTQLRQSLAAVNFAELNQETLCLPHSSGRRVK